VTVIVSVIIVKNVGDIYSGAVTVSVSLAHSPSPVPKTQKKPGRSPTSHPLYKNRPREFQEQNHILSENLRKPHICPASAAAARHSLPESVKPV
ncbi:MAG: hypothetical protein MPJ53_01545, partial [Alphaproteobacteria bacterium]|nr:hypothetical protein [Alphaproteobacteria bacterium]